MTPLLRTLTALVASLGLPLAADEPEPCYASIRLFPGPPFSGVQHVIAQGDEMEPYHESDLLLPEPVELSVRATDQDKIQYRCFTDCLDATIPGVWEVHWAIVPNGPEGTGGYFIDSNGVLVDELVAVERVLYLPPRGMAVGEEATPTVKATLVDACFENPAVRDQSWVLDFDVTVTRLATFEVMIAPGEITEAGGPQAPVCLSFPIGCCTRQGPLPWVYTGISAVISQAPFNGMLAGSTCIISIEASDDDLVFIDCGVYPCSYSGYSATVCDPVTFDWEILGAGNTGEIVSEEGQTILYKAPDGAAEITLKATLDDGGFADDDPIELLVTFPVFDFEVIDQNGQRIPQDFGDPDEAEDASLVISRVVTTHELGGCTGSDGTDRHTYRVRVDAPPSHQSWHFGTRVRARRPASPGGHEDGAPFDEQFEMAPNSGSIETWADLRLVSNTRPTSTQFEFHPMAVFDDEVCDFDPTHQTAYVKLGDWVEFEFLVGEHSPLEIVPIGSISLPVGRPWMEPSHVMGILEGRLEVVRTTEFTTAGAITECAHTGPPQTTHQGWNDVGPFLAQRASEDLAQAGISVRFESVEDGGPFLNTILGYGTGDLSQVGQIRIELELPDGTDEEVVVQIEADLTMQAVCNRIVAGINAALPQFPARRYDLYDNEEIIVVGRGTRLIVTSVDAGTTGLIIELMEQDWDDNWCEDWEMLSLGFNLKDVLPIEQETFEVIAVPNTVQFMVDGDAALGVTWPTGGGNYYGKLDGVLHTSFINGDVVSGWDRHLTMTLGHELGHILIDDNAHSGNDTHLMYASDPGWEVPERNKRIPSSLVTTMRQAEELPPQGSFLGRVARQIPPWK